MNQLLSVLQSAAVSSSVAHWTMNQPLSVLQSAAVSSSDSCCQFFSRPLNNESTPVSSSAGHWTMNQLLSVLQPFIEQWINCCQSFSCSLNNESSAISSSARHSAKFQSLLTAVLSNQQTTSSQSDRPPFQPTLLPPVTSLYRLKWRHSTLTTLVFLTTHAQCRNFVDQIRNFPT